MVSVVGIGNLNFSVTNYSCEGLDVEKDHILEMACVVTDEHLNLVKEVCVNHVLINAYLLSRIQTCRVLVLLSTTLKKSWMA